MERTIIGAKADTASSTQSALRGAARVAALGMATPICQNSGTDRGFTDVAVERNEIAVTASSKHGLSKHMNRIEPRAQAAMMPEPAAAPLDKTKDIAYSTAVKLQKNSAAARAPRARAGEDSNSAPLPFAASQRAMISACDGGTASPSSSRFSSTS